MAVTNPLARLENSAEEGGGRKSSEQGYQYGCPDVTNKIPLSTRRQETDVHVLSSPFSERQNSSKSGALKTSNVVTRDSWARVTPLSLFVLPERGVLPGVTPLLSLSLREGRVLDLKLFFCPISNGTHRERRIFPLCLVRGTFFKRVLGYKVRDAHVTVPLSKWCKKFETETRN